MAFVVEDGTGLSTATSYVSVAEFEDYWTGRGIDYTTTADATIEMWLNMATLYCDNLMAWTGTTVNDTQALLVPRSGWCDKRGRDIDDSVPTFLKGGVCELAHVRQAEFETSSSSGLKSENYGPVQITYSSDSAQAMTLYPSAMQWLSQGCKVSKSTLRVSPT